MLIKARAWGETTSYGRLAERLGTVARAVGAANGANPVALLNPCHRVIAADGRLGGSWCGPVGFVPRADDPASVLVSGNP